ncbi:hypothetical protein SMSP2_01540 [Limihaloglobus sulfuriphilus]|uniref:DUF91 domain-containing protein n=1 Tax=Limihaloglobus sulfuriphilus TaxID=1851148 RepID=A0A1Q2MEU2_9BACT|nr:endonuclease NucS domain-containing protein [Limihaloglobus sulfuriphilus]AQQ71174.1 hypothetical protein SMSP2_01540 [Limihaloglobus sulfuriphilus]
MPIEHGIWRIDKGLEKIDVHSLDKEQRLEEILDNDISIAAPNWMIIGRQVYTEYGSYIDLLAIDRDGNIVVLELKRNQTPREVVAQLLDYASWVKNLTDDEIASIFDTYINKFHPERNGISLDDAFMSYFNVNSMPDELNETHQLVIVASSLDNSTERILNYLSEGHNVPINAIFFRVFKDEDREYLSRMWFIEPTLSPPSPSGNGGDKEPWNGEFYASFGGKRSWEDARRIGYICGGGGSWYSNSLNLLEIGKRVWVNAPGHGYVGVGIVAGPVTKLTEFEIEDKGTKRLITEDDLIDSYIFSYSRNDEEKAEYLVKVDWIKTLSLDEAIKEKGLFGNQNTVCKPVAKKWQHTVERLKKRFDINK